MEDFDALAAALGADLEGVRACLIVSRDGLVIGAHPDEAENAAKPAWLRLAALGDPDRGFLQFATETWCYVRRGPYAAFAVATSSVRPGLLIDHIERGLVAAEVARIEHGPLEPEPAVTPSPTQRQPEVQAAEEVLTAEATIVLEGEPVTAATPAMSTGELAASPAANGAASAPSTEAAPDGATGARPSVWEPDASDNDGDAFSVLREFAKLLQDDEKGADG
jgi:hypothetical protein